MSQLFKIAAQAAQKLAVRQFDKTPIGKVIRAARRLSTGRRGSERRMRTLLNQITSPEARRLLDQLERVGPIKFGKAHERSDVLDRFLRLMGPIGDAIRRVVGIGKVPTNWTKNQVDNAAGVVRAFGNEVITRPGQPGYERGIEAAREALADIAEPPPFVYPTIGETGKPQSKLDEERLIEELLGGQKSEQSQPEDDYPEEESSIQTLGRGMGYDEEADAELIGREILVNSSNVYSFVFERESLRTGILYVTFLAWYPGIKERKGAGPTYAYYDVPLRKYNEFARAATTNSAGKAVWDYLRVRGSVWEHQHQYRIVAGVLMQDGGQYVARKSTAWGLRKRSIANYGTGRRGSVRSQLPERRRLERVHLPNRGEPNRGEPNRGNNS